MMDFFPEITREEILHEMARELVKRRDVFPRWVADGKLTQEEAEVRVNRLQAGYDWIRQNMPPGIRPAA